MTPVVGDVIWLPYQWKRPYPGDQQKIRPCYVLAVAEKDGIMHVLPITHTKPSPDRAARVIALDPAVAYGAGLDAQQNYLVCDEYNTFKRPTKNQAGTVGELKGEIASTIRDCFRGAMLSTPRVAVKGPPKPGKAGA